MRAIGLVLALIVSVAMVPAASAQEPEPAGEDDCATVSIEGIPPNYVAVNPPCAAEEAASLMPRPVDSIVLCVFYFVWDEVGPLLTSFGRLIIVEQTSAGTTVPC